MTRQTFGMAAVMMVATLAAAPAVADQSAPIPAPKAETASATVDKSFQWDFTSAVNGKTYRVRVAVPFAPPPPGGYPVMFVTDGYGFFGAVTDLVRLRNLGHEIDPVVVVGIGYPGEDIALDMVRRNLDLTPSQPDPDTATRMALIPGPKSEYAGADAFLKVIQTEIAPRLATLAPGNPKRTILYGHSLGGLFVLHTLFAHPDAFGTYIASSPSIWWNNRWVLNEEASFASAIRAGGVAPRVFIDVGGEEQTPPPPPYPPGLTREMMTKMAASARMVDNARDLGGRLAALKGAPGYAVETHIYPGETHLSVPFAAFNAALSFAAPTTTAH